MGGLFPRGALTLQLPALDLLLNENVAVFEGSYALYIPQIVYASLFEG